VYNITYTLDGGTNHASNPATYTIEDTPVTLQAPTKSEYTFNGWSDGGVIAEGSTGDKAFTAQWTAIPTYSVATGTFTGGEVTAGKAAYKENETVTLTIAPETGYLLESISAYKTGDTETPVALTGEGNERTFTMPAYGVTVTATFRSNEVGIQPANAPGVRISTGEGTIQAAFEGAALVKLYSVTGVLLNETTASNLYTCNAKQGVYILSVAGKSYKVMVK
jgi:uncharacterized repeat protein (TIGR02543 family)